MQQQQNKRKQTIAFEPIDSLYLGTLLKTNKNTNKYGWDFPTHMINDALFFFHTTKSNRRAMHAVQKYVQIECSKRNREKREKLENLHG